MAKIVTVKKKKRRVKKNENTEGRGNAEIVGEKKGK